MSSGDGASWDAMDLREKSRRGFGVLRRLTDPATGLLAAAILLPIGFFALAAWQSYRATIAEAEARSERTVRVLEEHALKVFETHRLVIQQVEMRMRFVDWSKQEDRDDLHRLLVKLQDDLDQVATVTVTDAEGRMLASGRVHPADPNVRFDDRDYFKALKRQSSSVPFVSRSYPGRQSGIQVFNLAERIHLGPGPPKGDEPFVGVIAVSVDRGYFEHFYESVEPTFDHSVVLVREDGSILARVPPTPSKELPPNSTLLAHTRLAPRGTYIAVSQLDGIERIFAYRKVGDYPIYVRFGISLQSALTSWRASLFGYGLVAGLASLALFAVSLLALRQTQRERLAHHRWEETAEALKMEASERNRIEIQLRQSQKMEALGRLTGGVAHDFNNLLTAVIGSLDLVRRRPQAIDERTLDLVSNALEGANRAAALTSRLLAFSRQQPLQAVRVDANALLAGMSALLRRTLGEAVQIETDFAEDLWAIFADPNQLESALLNLAVNGRDAMPNGGVLRISTCNAPLSQPPGEMRSDFVPGDYAALSVSDTGSGMSPDVLSNIFEPFFTTKPTGQGTGLGLSQVYGFIRQSGGQLKVESAIGTGSSFTLYLPRSLGEPVVPEAAEDDVSALPRAAAGETILVVEDEPMVCRLSVAALEDAGYRVLVAADGVVALAIVDAEPEIALLFTDVVLGGGINGRSLADEVHKTRPELPVLFTSGYTRDAFARLGHVDAGVAFIAKPFTSVALVAKVAELLGARDRSRTAAPAL